MKRIELNETLLRDLVEVQKLQQRHIAKSLGVCLETIARRCRQLKLKTQRTGPRSGSGHPRWRGGRHIDKDGYVEIWKPDHPHARNSRYVLEHRLMMERMLGRLLKPEEVVHHRNGNKQDNHPSNLVLFSRNGEHLRHELQGDFVHTLACVHKQPRPSILASLAGGAPLTCGASPRSRATFDRLVQAACAQLQIPVPAWFSPLPGSKIVAGPPLAH